MELRNNIDNLIIESTKSRNKERTEVFKAIKNEFLKHRTAKNAKPLDNVIEISILQKMIRQREESASLYEAGNRQDLADKERYEISVLSEFVPKAPTEEDIERVFVETFGNTIEQKQMGLAIKTLKEKLVGVDGAVLAKIVKTHIG